MSDSEKFSDVIRSTERSCAPSGRKKLLPGLSLICPFKKILCVFFVVLSYSWRSAVDRMENPPENPNPPGIL